MPPSIRHITFDCLDVERVGHFWAEALGYVDDPENPNEAGDPEWVIVPSDGRGPGLRFLAVPEARRSSQEPGAPGPPARHRA